MASRSRPFAGEVLRRQLLKLQQQFRLPACPGLDEQRLELGAQGLVGPAKRVAAYRKRAVCEQGLGKLRFRRGQAECLAQDL